MSGYGQATIVVEAGESSGVRIQARVGVEHGRPVILRDRVARMNKWAATLQHRARVHIVSSVDDVLGVVTALRPDLDDILADVLAVDGRAWRPTGPATIRSCGGDAGGDWRYRKLSF